MKYDDTKGNKVHLSPKNPFDSLLTTGGKVVCMQIAYLDDLISSLYSCMVLIQT